MMKNILTSLLLVLSLAGTAFADVAIDDLKNYIKQGGFVKSDDLVINLASMPMKEKGRTNMLKLSYIQ